MITLTEGIVLRKIKYGDSSQIIGVFTKRFGLQSYMIKGLGSSRSNNIKANLLSSGALLELSVYHREEKNIKFIQDVHPLFNYKGISDNVVKNCIVVFSVEVLQNLLVQDNIQSLLFNFSKEFFLDLDKENPEKLANYPLYFLVQVSRLSGYHIQGSYCLKTPFLNLNEGQFTEEESTQNLQLDSKTLDLLSRINKSEQIVELIDLRIPPQVRQDILNQYITFFEYHLPRFKPLKSVPILSAILS